VRIFVKTAWGVVFVDSFFSFFGTAYRNLNVDYMYLGGKRMAEIAYYTYHEMVYSIGVIIYIGIMILGVQLNLWKEFLFIATAITVFQSHTQSKESEIKTDENN